MIPSPTIYGYFMDLTCVVWQSSCTEDQSCQIYSVEKLRYTLFALGRHCLYKSNIYFVLKTGAVASFIGLLGVILATFTYKNEIVATISEQKIVPINRKRTEEMKAAVDDTTPLLRKT
jgi:hypothetical protein